MDAMSREALERLTTALHERIGAPCAHGEDVARVEPLRRQVRHAVIGIDAYLSAVEAGNGAAVELREQALDLWVGLERIASVGPGRRTAADNA